MIKNNIENLLESVSLEKILKLITEIINSGLEIKFLLSI